MKSKTVDRLLKSMPKDVEIFVDWYADLVVRINQLLKENNINKKELAAMLNKSPSEISKWMGGDHNFTLKSLAKLSAELGEPLLEIPKKKTLPEFTQGYSRSVHTFIVHKKKTPNIKSKVIDWQQSHELKFLSNVG